MTRIYSLKDYDAFREHIDTVINESNCEESIKRRAVERIVLEKSLDILDAFRAEINDLRNQIKQLHKTQVQAVSVDVEKDFK